MSTPIPLQVTTRSLNQNQYIQHSDDYCTYLTDVKAECCCYDFKDKWVYLPADDTTSAYWEYFAEGFSELGLRHLTALHKTDKGGIRYDIDSKEVGCITESHLSTSGDLFGSASLEIAKSCDVVVTTPPFSIAIDYAVQLLENHIKFLLILPMPVYSHPDIYRFLANDEIWEGVSNTLSDNMMFRVPESTPLDRITGIDSENRPYAKISARWVTNLPLATGKRFSRNYHFKIKYNPSIHISLDNYEAIYIPRLADIPTDYYGHMVVPVSFAKYYDPDKFEILPDHPNDLQVEGKVIKQYLLVRWRKNLVKGAVIGLLELIAPQYQDKDGNILWVCYCNCKKVERNVTLISESDLMNRINCHCGCLSQVKPPITTLENPEEYATTAYKKKLLETRDELFKWWQARKKEDALWGVWTRKFIFFHTWAVDHGYISGMSISNKRNYDRYRPDNIVFHDTRESIENWVRNPPKWWEKNIKLSFCFVGTTAGISFNVYEWSYILGVSPGELGALLRISSFQIRTVCVSNPVLLKRVTEFLTKYQSRKVDIRIRSSKIKPESYQEGLTEDEN